MPHELRASVRRPEVNDGTAIRLQGIRVIACDHPIIAPQGGVVGAEPLLIIFRHAPKY